MKKRFILLIILLAFVPASTSMTMLKEPTESLSYEDESFWNSFDDETFPNGGKYFFNLLNKEDNELLPKDKQVPCEESKEIFSNKKVMPSSASHFVFPKTQTTPVIKLPIPNLNKFSTQQHKKVFSLKKQTNYTEFTFKNGLLSEKKKAQKTDQLALTKKNKKYHIEKEFPCFYCKECNKNKPLLNKLLTQDKLLGHFKSKHPSVGTKKERQALTGNDNEQYEKLQNVLFEKSLIAKKKKI